MTPHAYSLVEQTFDIKIATCEKFSLTYNSKQLKNINL